ncbi:hypothetical protein Phum_PHUM394370 [Pediculus humanus corporis]|uniref:Low-density lipoprotein receptor n=1 Tax=Pediculus humanus subsp. corporis TaxID=121224 RepID=E0VR73_PEDHC|nr:uncharacterized protein Phum_PHUM394370 [Pediculus humanus corporis]EEB15879.1 hypothetical protein Phum_PHUM394370 [Pediculus humanus corporis]
MMINRIEHIGVIFTRTNFVTLKYVTDNWGTENNGFRLVITAVKDPKHECRDFRCHQKEFCIHPELLCDGISHCADGSDESSPKCSKNDSGYILGISLPIFVVVSISFLLILTALGVIAGIIFCRNRPSMQQSTPSHSQHPRKRFPPFFFSFLRITLYSLMFRHFSFSPGKPDRND